MAEVSGDVQIVSHFIKFYLDGGSGGGGVYLRLAVFRLRNCLFVDRRVHELCVFGTCQRNENAKSKYVIKCKLFLHVAMT